MPQDAAVGAAAEMKMHLLPITLLPAPHETANDAQIIEDWSRGLDWVKWLLGSVRARTEMLLVADVAGWKDFGAGVLLEAAGPALKAAWQSAHANDLVGMIAAAGRLSAQLTPEAARRSLRAGAVLLKSTQHARYQGILGRLREAVEQGRCEGHIAIVWAAVGHFFQLSLTNVIAEYLRLEWDIATRDAPEPAPFKGAYSIAALTRRVMHEAASEAALRVLDA